MSDPLALLTQWLPDKRVRWALVAALLATAAVAVLPDDDIEPAGDAPATRGAVPHRLPEGSRTRNPDAWPAGPRERGTASWSEPSTVAQAAWGADSRPVVPLARSPRPVAQPTIELPPATPEDPPPPYTLIGRIDDGADPRALLLGAQRTLAVKRGDTVDGLWRVEAVHADGVTLVSLRVGQRLTLHFKPA